MRHGQATGVTSLLYLTPPVAALVRVGGVRRRADAGDVGRHGGRLHRRRDGDRQRRPFARGASSKSAPTIVVGRSAALSARSAARARRSRCSRPRRRRAPRRCPGGGAAAAAARAHHDVVDLVAARVVDDRRRRIGRLETWKVTRAARRLGGRRASACCSGRAQCLQRDQQLEVPAACRRASSSSSMPTRLMLHHASGRRAARRARSASRRSARVARRCRAARARRRRRRWRPGRSGCARDLRRRRRLRRGSAVAQRANQRLTTPSELPLPARVGALAERDLVGMLEVERELRRRSGSAARAAPRGSAGSPPAARAGSRRAARAAPSARDRGAGAGRARSSARRRGACRSSGGRA